MVWPWRGNRGKAADMARKGAPDLEAARQALERQRGELEEMSAAAALERRPVELDQQSVGRDSQEHKQLTGREIGQQQSRRVVVNENGVGSARGDAGGG